MSYEQLIQEHDEIDAACVLLLSHIQADPPRVADASHTLAMLARILRDHLAGEDEMLYPTILATSGGRHADLAELLISELAELKEDWTEYLARWEPAQVASRWTRFGTETVAMMKRLRNRVARETAMLYPLALQHSVIALRR